MGCLLPHAGWWFLGSLLLVAPQQGTSWYKHSASPRYHTVGRASGLLIGVRRSPYLWRREVSGDNHLDVQQGAPEGRDVIQGQEEDADTRYLQYPGQEGVRRLIEERFPWKTEEDKSGEINRGNKEQREEERSLEEIRRGVQLQEQERSLEEVKRGVQVPGEDEMMSLSETKRIQEPGQGGINMEEVTGRLKIPEGGQDKSLEASEVTILMPGERKLHYQEESWSHSQPWRRQPSAEYQPFQANSRPTELLNCEDFTSTFYKVLCKGGLRVLSRSQLRLRSQRPEVERPGSPL